MSDDDEMIAGDLLELLEAALDEAPTEPPPDRVAALRARARAAGAMPTPTTPAGGRWLLAAAAAAVAVLAGVGSGERSSTGRPARRPLASSSTTERSPVRTGRRPRPG